MIEEANVDKLNILLKKISTQLYGYDNTIENGTINVLCEGVVNIAYTEITRLFLEKVTIHFCLLKRHLAFISGSLW